MQSSNSCAKTQGNKRPMHEVARERAMQKVLQTLQECNGAIPKPASFSSEPFGTNRACAEFASAVKGYTEAVHRECECEVYGMVDSYHIPDKNKEWFSLDVRGIEAKVDFGCAYFGDKKLKDKVHDLDYSMVLVGKPCLPTDGSIGTRQFVVGFLHHTSKTDKMEFLGGASALSCDLVDVLGNDHRSAQWLATRAANLGGHPSHKHIASSIGYVGDLINAVMGTEQMNPEKAAANMHLMRTLTSGQRVPVQWPLVDHAKVPNLNDSQLAALNGLRHNVELIRGPPGTGKSTLINAMVAHAFGPDEAACVIAVQNKAVEAIASKFIQTGTPFVATGTRMSEITKTYSIEEQVSRNPEVRNASRTYRAATGLKNRICKIVRDAANRLVVSVPVARPPGGNTSLKLEARWERIKELFLEPESSKMLADFDDYKKWKQRWAPKNDADAEQLDCKDFSVDDLNQQDAAAAKKELNAIVNKFMTTVLDPWRKVAMAVTKKRFHEALDFVEGPLRAKIEAARERVQSTERRVRQGILRNARALLCTTATVGRVLRNGDVYKELITKLTTIVVDEAGTVADRHIATVMGATSICRMIMVGDTKQLSVFSNIRRSNPVSLMKRLENFGSIQVAALTTQYRMPEELCKVVSRSFYDDSLRTAKGRVQKQTGSAFAIQFVAVDGQSDTPSPKCTSVFNAEEARELIRHLGNRIVKLREMGVTDDAPPLSIAVITTYSAQLHHIRSLLKTLDFGNVCTVDAITVDAAQGNEWDVVYYSHVVSDRHRMGFTTNPNRLCVALSRAREEMVVLAHPEIVNIVKPLKTFRDQWVALYGHGPGIKALQNAEEADRENAKRMQAPCCFCNKLTHASMRRLECDSCHVQMNDSLQHRRNPPRPVETHFVCGECADEMVNNKLKNLKRDGASIPTLRCPLKKCNAPPYNTSILAKALSPGVFDRLNEARLEHESAKAKQIIQSKADENLAREFQKLNVERANLLLERDELAKLQKDDIWFHLAKGIETEEEVADFFRRRTNTTADGTTLQIVSATKTVNERSLRAFASSGHFSMNTKAARANCADTFLFHGSPASAVANITLEGLSKKFAGNGMLGRGIYGAPDPRKSMHYTDKVRNNFGGVFMMICRFNLDGAEHAGPHTPHKNSTFEEFMVHDDRRVVVLWTLKVK